MDSPTTIPTLTHRKIQVLHVEPTDVCQAVCPQCARETDPHFDHTQHQHLSIEQLEHAVPFDTLVDLEKLFMCGSYGDPAAGRYTMDIYRWIRQINPDVTLGMNTNGALRDRSWWKEIASLFNRPTDYVVFSIDGLEDTNHLYRIGVDWLQLMRNAKAFIDHGGSAHWDMLIYRHNEHQVKACQQLARDLGFTWFRAKVSRRPLVGALESPITWAQPTAGTVDTIECRALKEQSLYIDAHGRVSPCCWLGSRKTDFVTDLETIQQSWEHTPHPVCASACAVNDGLSNFERQWQQEICLRPA